VTTAVQTVEVKAAPAAGGSPPEAVAAQHAGLVESTVRVDVRLLDHLMDLVGELVLTATSSCAKALPALAGAAPQRCNG